MILVLALGCALAASACPRRSTMTMSESAGAFPPRWGLGDSWSVLFTTEAPTPADMPPRFADHIYHFKVAALPDGDHRFYRLEAQPDDPAEGDAFVLRFRVTDRSLLGVGRVRAGVEAPVLENGALPFIYYDRRLPIVPDFPIQWDPRFGDRPLEFKTDDRVVTQRVEAAPGGVRVVLEAAEPSGTLRVILVWRAGDPWWSRIECREDPPAGAPFEGRVVASGHLLEGAESQGEQHGE
jgi:hypothetical protein